MNREKEQNRKLSKAERLRSEKFNKIKEELMEKGYESIDLTIGIVYANKMAFVLTLPVIIGFAVVFGFFNDIDFIEFIQSLNFGNILYLLMFFAVFMGLIFAHELIHGITWAVFAKKHWKAISFGYIAEYMTSYCTCDEALKKNEYILGSLMPTIALGVIPTIIAIFTGSFGLFIIGALMIMSGGGDLTIILNLMKFQSKCEETLYIDHPYQVGLVAFIR